MCYNSEESRGEAEIEAEQNRDDVEKPEARVHSLEQPFEGCSSNGNAAGTGWIA
jgi:hypothetical protein